MSEMKVNDAIRKVLNLVKPMLEERDVREVDSLLGNIHSQYKSVYAKAYGQENENGIVETESGQILSHTMDKSINGILSVYGLSLERVKEQIDELNSEGLAPVEKIILPSPTVLGVKIEFDEDCEFPEFE